VLIAQNFIQQGGGPGFDDGASITTDADGNIYVTGDFSGTATFGDSTLISKGSSDVYVVKYNFEGDVLWARSGGGSSVDQSSGITTDANGNVYVTGGFTNTSTFGSTSLVSLGSFDAFVVKYSATGSLVWATSGGGTDNDQSTDISSDAAGNVYITGYYQGTGYFGSATLFGHPNNSSFIVKYNAAGNVLWARTSSGTNLEVGLGISNVANGHVYITGYFVGTAGFGGFSLTNNGSADVFVVKYNSNTGSVIWARSGGGSSFDEGRDLITDDAGDVYVTGSVRNTGFFGSSSYLSTGNSDVLVLKYSATGNVIWVRSEGGTDGDLGSSITTYGTNEVYVTGSYQGTATFGDSMVVSNGDYDIFISKYKAAGDVLWARSGGGIDGDFGIGITTDTENDVYVTGAFAGTATFGDSTLVSSGGLGDMFAVRLSSSGVWPASGSRCLTGGITFTSQSQVDSFPINYPTCTEITGNVEITGSDITHLDSLQQVVRINGDLDIYTNPLLPNLIGLENINQVTGDILIAGNNNMPNLMGFPGITEINELQIISNTALTTLQGLESLVHVGDWLAIFNNDSLLTLSGLDQLNIVDHRLQIDNNDLLIDMNGLSSLETTGRLDVMNNASLKNCNGLSDLSSINFILNIDDNNNMVDLSGMEALTYIKRVAISENDILSSLTGLGGPMTVIDTFSFYIGFNPMLSYCDVESVCNYLSVPSNAVNITSNNYGCNTRAQVEETCETCPPNIYTFSSQEQIDLFPGHYPNCSSLGQLTTIMGSDITNLDSLIQITSVTNTLIIEDNPLLTDISGLDNIETIGTSLQINNNPLLTEISGFNSLTSTIELSINFNSSLNSITGFEGLTVLTSLTLLNMPLTDITGLQNVDAITNTLGLELIDIDNLSSLGNIDPTDLQHLILLNCPNLEYCHMPNFCFYLSDMTNTANISGNAPGCETRTEVEMACETQPFFTAWKTDNPGLSNNNTIVIPTGSAAATFSYSVIWGDGTLSHHTGAASHTYEEPGIYPILIDGTFPHMEFGLSGDEDKLIAIVQWGDQAWTSMRSSFAGCDSLEIFAIDTPDLSMVTDMSSMFSYSSITSNLHHWDVSNVTDMTNLFEYATLFNGNISDWDVGNVNSMSRMFIGASSFNQPLNSWNVGNVDAMNGMFGEATNFNQDLSNWDVSQVTKSFYMFWKATAFDQDISEWDVGNVTLMYNMFEDATAFDQNIGSWDVSQVTNIGNMFLGASLSVNNYDSLLIGWGGLPSLQFGISFNGGNSMYCAGDSARQQIIDDHGWTIIDGGPASGIINTWTGTTGDWHDDSNWSAGGIPNHCDEVIIPNGAEVNIYNGRSASCHIIDVATGAILEVELGAVLNVMEPE